MRLNGQAEQMLAAANRNMAEQLLEVAQWVKRGECMNHLYVGQGDPRRVLLTSSNREDDTTGSCLAALIGVDEQLMNLEHGTVTIKIQDGTAVLVEIATKYRPIR